MSRKLVSVILLVFLLPLFPDNSAVAEEHNSRLQFPNDFGIELAGKAFAYSFTYQRMMGGHLGLEGGISALAVGDDDDNASVIFFPLGTKLYMLGKDGSPFLTGGAVLLTASADIGSDDATASTAYGYAGLGFEFRGDGGFVFRGTAYVMFPGGEFFIWPGLYVGYAF